MIICIVISKCMSIEKGNRCYDDMYKDLLRIILIGEYAGKVCETKDMSQS